jgi:DNA-binding transcriptional MerR regulator
MELQTISQVSKAYDISARMLRYYEQAGLISSRRNESNAYRYYDEAALRRVQQITILRKLQIPVKQICAILDNPDAAAVIDIFKANIAGLDSEITALSTIRTILEQFVQDLERIADQRLGLDFLGDDAALKLAGALSMVQRNVKEKPGMADLDRAADVLSRLRNVRVIFLPPMTVAAAFFAGDKPEKKAWKAITNFIKQNNLLKIKPDLRVFRFEHANATGKSFGHEVWVSIPDDFAVPAPLAKKRFLGGQYAAHVLGDDGFVTYLGLQDWINESDKYQYDYDGNLLRCDPPIEEIDSFGGMRLDPEEILNYRNYNSSKLPGPGMGDQIDVLFPIRDYVPQAAEAPRALPDSEDRCGYKASIVTKNKFRIMGFTKIVTPETNGGNFEDELRADDRLDLLHRFRKPGAPLLLFASLDMDAQLRGGNHRESICLLESDITDVRAFMELGPYVRTIDAAKWLIFEVPKEAPFNDHSVCMRLGYTWNGTISGSISVRPDGKLGDVNYCWYPVK